MGRRCNKWWYGSSGCRWSECRQRRCKRASQRNIGSDLRLGLQQLRRSLRQSRTAPTLLFAKAHPLGRLMARGVGCQRLWQGRKNGYIASRRNCTGFILVSVSASHQREREPECDAQNRQSDPASSSLWSRRSVLRFRLMVASISHGCLNRAPAKTNWERHVRLFLLNLGIGIPIVPNSTNLSLVWERSLLRIERPIPSRVAGW